MCSTQFSREKSLKKGLAKRLILLCSSLSGRTRIANEKILLAAAVIISMNPNAGTRIISILPAAALAAMAVLPTTKFQNLYGSTAGRQITSFGQ